MGINFFGGKEQETEEESVLRGTERHGGLLTGWGGGERTQSLSALCLPLLKVTPWGHRCPVTDAFHGGVNRQDTV